MPGTMSKVPTDLTPMWRDVAALMLNSTRKTFEVGGRPGRWQALKRGGPAMLRRSGGLLRTLRAEVSPFSATVVMGEGVPYAKIHQYGGTIPHPGSSKFQRFIVEGKWISTNFTRPHPIVMPPRPYLLFQAEDIEAIGQMAMGYIVNFMNTNKERIA